MNEKILEVENLIKEFEENKNDEILIEAIQKLDFISSDITMNHHIITSEELNRFTECSLKIDSLWDEYYFNSRW